MKKLAAMFLMLTFPAYGHGHRNPDVDVTQTNEQTVNVTVNTPPGPAGEQGVAGKDGATGATGAAGERGADGSNATVDRTITVNVGAAVQWHEWDNRVSLNSGYRFDIHHRGHTIDALVVGYRFGKSAEDRRIDELKKEIAALKTPVVIEEKKKVEANDDSLTTIMIRGAQ